MLSYKRICYLRYPYEAKLLHLILNQMNYLYFLNLKSKSKSK